MASKNDITGDTIISKKNNKQYEAGYKLIKPICLADCNYLVDTLTKCRVCDWHPKKRKDDSK